MVDLHKAAQLASELIDELERQGQTEGELGEVLSQFLTEVGQLDEKGDGDGTSS